MRGINGFYLFIIALCAGMLFINAKYFRGSTFSNVGITYAKEYKISSDRSGRIKSVRVVPGQEVQTGDLLLEMENADLDIQIIKLSTQIKSLQKEKEEKKQLLHSKIEYMEAESGIKLEELDSEMQMIASEQALNRRLTDRYGLAAGPTAPLQAGLGPEDLRVSSLVEKRKLHKQAAGIRMKDFRKDHQTSLMLLDNQMDLLNRELALLKDQKKKLNKYATEPGVIKSVSVLNGEEVDAFAPIITINPTHPSSVVGYSVGTASHNAVLGQRVTVSSFDDKRNAVQGEVIGFGGIVELPLILQKSTAVKAFGKEVFIKVDENNHFATGEKVLIR
jgi:multidrug resistance efflux pump